MFEIGGHALAAVLVILLASGFLVSCGGGSVDNSSATSVTVALVPSTLATTSPVGSSSGTGTSGVPVTLTYFLPNTKTSSTVTQTLSRRLVLGTSNYGGYTSTAAAATISLTVTPLNGAAAGPYTGPCTPAGGTSGTCSVSFTAAPGATTFAGTIIESGNVIAKFSQLEIIQPTTANSITFTASPVVASVGLVLSAPTTYLNTTLNSMLPAVTAGTASDVPLVVNAYDANSNIIAGSASYVDANGKPLAILLSTVNSQLGGSGVATITGPMYISAPGQAATKLHYNGRWLDYMTVTATTTSSLVAATSTKLTTIPHATEIGAGTQPGVLTLGPDGNVWYTSFSQNNIGKMTPAGFPSLYTMGITANSAPNYIIAGPDGNMWFGEYSSHNIARISLSGSVKEFGGLSGSPFSITPINGKLYVADCGGACTGGPDNIGIVNTNGTVSYTPTNGSGDGPSCGTLGPDGNLWIGYQGSNEISRFTSTLQETDYTYVNPNGAYFQSCDMITGPDKNIWFIDPSMRAIGRYSFAMNAILLFSTGISNNPLIEALTNGIDGEIWFTENNNGKLGRMDVNGNVIEYGTVNGLPGNAAPSGITKGSDGNIWFGDTNNNAVGVFVY